MLDITFQVTFHKSGISYDDYLIKLAIESATNFVMDTYVFSLVKKLPTSTIFSIAICKTRGQKLAQYKGNFLLSA